MFESAFIIVNGTLNQSCFVLDCNKYRNLQVVKTISGQRKLILAQSKYPSNMVLVEAASTGSAGKKTEGKKVMLCPLASCDQ